MRKFNGGILRREIRNLRFFPAFEERNKTPVPDLEESNKTTETRVPDLEENNKTTEIRRHALAAILLEQRRLTLNRCSRLCRRASESEVF